MPSVSPNGTRRRRPPSPSMDVMAERLAECEDDIQEVRRLISDMNHPQTGIIASITGETSKLKDRLNLWGGLLIGAGVASGLITGEAGTLIKSIGAGSLG